MYQIIKDVIESYKKNAEQVLLGKVNYNRSTKKVDNIHEQIASDINWMLKQKMPAEEKYRFLAISKGTNKREGQVKGMVNMKNADVMIIDQRSTSSNVVALLEFKAPLSSIQQNEHNYVENATGECVNIKINKKLYYELFAVPVHAPNFKNAPDGKIVKNFADDAGKFMIEAAEKRMLVGRIDKYAAPDAIGILCIKSPVTDTKNKIVTQKDYSELVKNFYSVSSEISNYDSFYENVNNTDHDPALLINDYREFLNTIVNDLIKEKWKN